MNMKKIIVTMTMLLIMFAFMLTACGKEEKETEAVASSAKKGKTEIVQQYTIEDPDATDLVAYFGVRAEEELEEIPTFDNFLLSQEKSHISDFTGTNYSGGND